MRRTTLIILMLMMHIVDGSMFLAENKIRGGHSSIIIQTYGSFNYITIVNYNCLCNLAAHLVRLTSECFESQTNRAVTSVELGGPSPTKISPPTWLGAVYVHNLELMYFLNRNTLVHLQIY